MQSFWMLGTVAEAGLAWLVLGPLGWRWLLALSSLPLFLLTLLFPLLPESPFFLASVGRTASAQQVLERAARANGRSLPKVIQFTTILFPAVACLRVDSDLQC